MSTVDELRGLTSDELAEKLDEVQEEYFNLRFQNATGQLENFAQIKLVKRDIARIRTIVHERRIGIEIEPKPAKQSKLKPRKARKAKADKDEGADDDAGED